MLENSKLKKVISKSSNEISKANV